MIFIGDIALPMSNIVQTTLTHQFSHSPVIANLEGAIIESQSGNLRKFKLFNDICVIEYLRFLNVKVVSLANNHILDCDPFPSNTVRILKGNNISACGAGNSLEEAMKPAVINHNGKEIRFLAFGWEPINCIAAREKKPGVNPLQPKIVLKCVREERKKYPESIIVLLLHWDYELELYPQPMHRQLAFDAIYLGANAIIGHHPHCVQGIEVYKNSPIVYSLGNWFIPHGFFGNGNLCFPDFSRRQLAFEWNPQENNMICHWFEYKNINHEIAYIKSEKLYESFWIEELTPFKGFSHNEYIDWFRNNRRKKRFLPIYKNYNNVILNNIFNKWVNTRQNIIKLLIKLNLKKKPR